MRLLIILLIRLYWLTKPKRMIGRCIFRVSCSKYVYNVAKNDGFILGIKAFIIRFKRCRSIYRLEKHNGKQFIRLKDNYLADLTELNDWFIKQVRETGWNGMDPFK